MRAREEGSWQWELVGGGVVVEVVAAEVVDDPVPGTGAVAAAAQADTRQAASQAAARGAREAAERLTD